VATALSNTEPNMTWITLWLVDGQGHRTSVACLTESGVVAADALEVNFADFQRMRTDMACKMPSSD
jgi:hypothetical protein